VHAKPLEEKFVAEGHGVKRQEVMYNDFVLVGPKQDPAKVGGSRDIVAALKKIAQAKAPFASRGDKSGTHFAELQLWKAAGLDPAKHPHVKREMGQAFIDWLLSTEGQQAIGDYKIDGQQLFFPNAS
jgi:ABC-type tungstate transport system permease subunit